MPLCLWLLTQSTIKHSTCAQPTSSWPSSLHSPFPPHPHRFSPLVLSSPLLSLPHHSHPPHLFLCRTLPLPPLAALPLPPPLAALPLPPAPAVAAPAAAAPVAAAPVATWLAPAPRPARGSTLWARGGQQGSCKALSAFIWPSHEDAEDDAVKERRIARAQIGALMQRAAAAAAAPSGESQDWLTTL